MAGDIEQEITKTLRCAKIPEVRECRMPEPLISVIMPTYNRAKFIGEAVTSVLNQSWKDLELIVVDNYSTDDTQQVISSFRDPRLRYYKFFNNGKIGIIAATRNYGIQQGRGRYMAFLDSDDVWSVDKLAQQMDVLEKDKRCQMVFCQFRVSDASGKLQERIMGPKNFKMNGYIYHKLIRYNFIVCSSVIVRKDILDKIGCFDERKDLTCSEDFDLWLRIARNNRVVFLPRILGAYRLHTLNTNIDNQRLQKALNVIDKHLLDGLTGEREANRAKANFYFREGWFTIDKDVRFARACFRESCSLNFYNFKILFLSLMGLMLSFTPFLYKFIRRKELDKKLSRLLLNHQSL